ncbi:MAG: restriction endonuclease subunit S, partial [Phascolarctobacterium sp.]
AGSLLYYDGTIPFLKVADITRCDSPYVTCAEYTIKEAGLKKTRMVEENTLLLTNSGATLGVPAICTFKTTFNDGIAAFLELDKRSVKFLYYFFASKTKDLRSINKGAAQPNLNTDIIGEININIPLLSEQQEIVRIVDLLLDKEQKAKEAAESVLEQIDLMKKSILARAFRGELGTNDPAEPSSMELLKQVLADKE